MTALLDNLTLEEMERFDMVPDFYLKAARVSEQAVQDRIDEAVEKELESIREQLYFARELIDIIEEDADKFTKMTEFRKAFRSRLDESSFER